MVLNVGMIDLDQQGRGTRFPNLAQMKISSWLKSKGHNVSLIWKNLENVPLFDLMQYDLLVVSKVFDSTPVPAALNSLMGGASDPLFLEQYNLDIPAAISECMSETHIGTMIAIGGTGFFPFGGRNLAPEIEHSKPDYHLYDEMVSYYKDNKIRSKSWFIDFENYSIGFMTRGCFRKCEFCVNRKYDKVRPHSPISEFIDPNRPKIALWDDNILGYAQWETIINELKATGKPFCFRQGMDIRLMSDKKAKVLSECRYDGNYTFAFDHIKDKDLVVRKLKLWKKYNKGEPVVYVLCGFDPLNDPNVSPLDDVINTWERIRILSELGCMPYIMRHKAYLDSPYKGIYIALARWVNQRGMFRNKSILEWVEIDSVGKANGSKSKRDVLEFAKRHPEIAEKYFNMRYKDIRGTGLSKEEE